MKTYFQMALLGAFLLMFGVAWQSALAQTPQRLAAGPSLSLTSEQVVNKLVRRNLERTQALAAYQGTRVYRFEYRGFPGFKTAEMIVDMKYRSPGTKEFEIRSKSGSGFVIDQVFQKLLQSEKEAVTEQNQARVALNKDNYRFTLTGYENLPTGPCYILAVEPLTKNKLLYRGRIWVDAEDFAVVRIDAAPAKNPSFWTKETKIEQVYSKIGEFWLPLSNRSNSVIRLGGRAYLTIDYQDYQIMSATPPSKRTSAAEYDSAR